MSASRRSQVVAPISSIGSGASSGASSRQRRGQQLDCWLFHPGQAMSAVKDGDRTINSRHCKSGNRSKNDSSGNIGKTVNSSYSSSSSSSSNNKNNSNNEKGRRSTNSRGASEKNLRTSTIKRRLGATVAADAESCRKTCYTSTCKASHGMATLRNSSHTRNLLIRCANVIASSMMMYESNIVRQRAPDAKPFVYGGRCISCGCDCCP